MEKKLAPCRCGDCCKMAVRLTKQDIERFKKDVISVEGKLVKDIDGKLLLGKKPDGYCHFFKWENEQGVCSIYESRPKICRDFECEPFKKFASGIDFVTLRKSDGRS